MCTVYLHVWYCGEPEHLYFVKTLQVNSVLLIILHTCTFISETFGALNIYRHKAY